MERPGSALECTLVHGDHAARLHHPERCYPSCIPNVLYLRGNDTGRDGVFHSWRSCTCSVARESSGPIYWNDKLWDVSISSIRDQHHGPILCVFETVAVASISLRRWYHD